MITIIIINCSDNGAQIAKYASRHMPLQGDIIVVNGAEFGVSERKWVLHKAGGVSLELHCSQYSS